MQVAMSRRITNVAETSQTIGSLANIFEKRIEFDVVWLMQSRSLQGATLWRGSFWVTCNTRQRNVFHAYTSNICGVSSTPTTFSKHVLGPLFQLDYGQNM